MVTSLRVVTLSAVSSPPLRTTRSPASSAPAHAGPSRHSVYAVHIGGHGEDAHTFVGLRFWPPDTMNGLLVGSFERTSVGNWLPWLSAKPQVQLILKLSHCRLGCAITETFSSHQRRSDSSQKPLPHFTFCVSPSHGSGIRGVRGSEQSPGESRAGGHV